MPAYNRECFLIMYTYHFFISLPDRISFVTQYSVPQDKLTIGLTARGSNPTRYAMQNKGPSQGGALFCMARPTGFPPSLMLRGTGSLMLRELNNEVPLLLSGKPFESFFQNYSLISFKGTIKVKGSGTSMLPQSIWWVGGDPNI